MADNNPFDLLEGVTIKEAIRLKERTQKRIRGELYALTQTTGLVIHEVDLLTTTANNEQDELQAVDYVVRLDARL